MKPEMYKPQIQQTYSVVSDLCRQYLTLCAVTPCSSIPHTQLLFDKLAAPPIETKLSYKQGDQRALLEIFQRKQRIHQVGGAKHTQSFTCTHSHTPAGMHTCRHTLTHMHIGTYYTVESNNTHSFLICNPVKMKPRNAMNFHYNPLIYSQELLSNQKSRSIGSFQLNINARRDLNVHSTLGLPQKNQLHTVCEQQVTREKTYFANLTISS